MYRRHMDDLPKRLRAARTHAGYRSAAAAARAFGWPPERYKSHENGGRGVKQPDIVAYAKAFRVEPEWLLFGRSPPKWLAAAEPPVLQPVRTTVFPEIDWKHVESYCRLFPDVRGIPVISERVHDLSVAKPGDGAFCLRIRDRSMISTAGGVSFDIGDIITCNPSSDFEPGAFVIAIPDIGSTEPVIRRLQLTGVSEAGPAYALVPLNPDFPTLTVSGVGKLMARVVAVTRHL